MRYDDLPKAMRDQVDRQLGKPPGGGRARPSRGGTGDGQPCEYRCGCNETFPTFTAWERHSRAGGRGHSTGRQVLPE